MLSGDFGWLAGGPRALCWGCPGGMGRVGVGAGQGIPGAPVAEGMLAGQLTLS